MTGVLCIKTKECKIVDCRWRTEKNSRRKAIPIADYTASPDDDSDSAMEYTWTTLNLKVYLQWINEDKGKPEYETTIIKNTDSSVTEKIFIPQSSSFYELKFSLTEGKWMLNELIVNQL